MMLRTLGLIFSALSLAGACLQANPASHAGSYPLLNAFRSLGTRKTAPAAANKRRGGGGGGGGGGGTQPKRSGVASAWVAAATGGGSSGSSSAGADASPARSALREIFSARFVVLWLMILHSAVSGEQSGPSITAPSSRSSFLAAAPSSRSSFLAAAPSSRS